MVWLANSNALLAVSYNNGNASGNEDDACEQEEGCLFVSATSAPAWRINK
jgi:hypothetical protein